MQQLSLWPVFLLAAVAGAPVLAQPASNTIEFSNCTLELPGTVLTADANCGWLEVAENPAEPDGRKIRMHVAIVPAAGRDAEPDPLFFFAGGPGQAASEAYVGLRPILSKIRRKRDIVLVDQRGTGKSNPLDCPVEEPGLDTNIDIEQILQQTRSCLDALDGDPRYYTTTIAMQDYDSVRRAMGYEQINLLGISYGTRAAQNYLKQFPQTVRSVILDSVVPPDLILGDEHAEMLDRAVYRVLADCAGDSACNERFPDLRQNLNFLLDQLHQEAPPVRIVHPTSGEEHEFAMQPDVMAAALRFLSYSSRTQALLPLLIHEAAENQRYDRIATQALLVMSGLTDQLSRGMELSVICAEDYPHMDDNDNDEGTIMGATLIETIREQCALWPKGQVPEDFHQPIASNTPVLLLSGERDPVTPPIYGDRAARQFSNSLHLVAGGQGHSVITHPCLREVATAFIAAADVEALDTGCVEKIQASPFFTTLSGPTP